MQASHQNALATGWYTETMGRQGKDFKQLGEYMRQIGPEEKRRASGRERVIALYERIAREQAARGTAKKER